MYVSGFGKSPYGVDWNHFEDDAPYPDLVKTIPHVAFEVDPIVLTLRDFENAVRGNSFNTENGKLLHLFFLSADSPSPELSVLEKYKSPSEEYELKGRVLYLYAPGGVGRSKLVTKVQKAMGVPLTARNWNTVQKLISLTGMQKPHQEGGHHA